MKDEIIVKTFRQKELYVIREELYQFLLGLGEEKRTLFPELSSEESYPDTCRWLVNVSILVTVGFLSDRIVGASGLRRTKKGFLGGLWPVIRGYSVVAEDFQGKGIGSRLMEQKNRAMKKLFSFHVSEVVRGNVPMERLLEKSSYLMVHRDDSYTYYYKACRGFMTLFAPIFELIYRRSLRGRTKAKSQTLKE